MEIEFLDSGIDLEDELRRRNLRRRRRWWMRLSRKTWFILGAVAVLLLGLACLAAVFVSQVVSFG